MKRLTRLAAVAAFAMMAGTASAQTDTHAGPIAGTFYIAGLAGAAFPLGDGDSDFTWGAEVGHHYTDLLTYGLYFSTLGSTIGSGELASSSSTSFVTAFGDYYLTPAFHLGVMAGVAISSAEGPGFDDSSTNLTVGARAGYDIGITRSISVGPEANVLFNTAEGADPILNILGALKFHI